MKESPPTEVTQLEIDLLLLYYNFADQFGVVDIPAAKIWAKKKLGITLSDAPFTFEQKHINFLMDREAMPDIRSVLHRLSEDRKNPPVS